MFTGIIVDCGVIRKIENGEKSRKVWIAPDKIDAGELDLGASVCCDGCCLTVAAKEEDAFVVDIGAETLDKTTLSAWREGARINLEPSLKLGDELGGHIVSGHIDGVATLTSVVKDGESWRLKIKVPEDLARFIAPKGSVALNGVSLTVNEVEGDVFGVCIIPHTWAVTTLSALEAGDPVNIEVDMLARYVARILGKDAA